MKSFFRHKKSLRVLFSKTAVTTMCLSCIVAFLLVCGGIVLFYDGEFTITLVMVSCLIVCLLATIIGIHILLVKAKMFIEPIEKVNNAVNSVATGDFSACIDAETGKNAIDEFVMLEQNFNKMTKELRGMDFMRKDFISNVSHEIKTPIAAIAGFTEILEGDGLSEEEKTEYLGLIKEEAMRLTRLCESMLNMSRLDNQEIVARKESVNISEQIRKSIIFLSDKWGNKNQEFDLFLENIVVESDPDLLYQVWVNLLDNAIKYAPENSVISIGGKEEGSLVSISIMDKGAGIEPQKIEHIFDQFYQCEESHKKQGNGLGLSIVKRIMELLDGEILCESTVGVGTTFTVKLKK